MKLEFTSPAKVNEVAKEIAKKLHIKMETEDNISAFVAHILYLHPKIVLGLLDSFLPADVEEAWVQLVSLLEENDRKMIGVDSGSLVFNVYCPTTEARELLKQLTDSDRLAESFTIFTKAAGL